jgi:sortase B
MRKRPVFYYRRRKKRLRILIGIAFVSGIALLITAIILLVVPAHSEPEEVAEITALPIVTIVPSANISASPAATDDYLVASAKEGAGKNEDVVGWIRIEGTIVDYPVVQTDDITYYLTHDAEKNENVNGAIFLDRNCDPVSLKGNNILYGHHMKDGSMFAALIQYNDEAFLKIHPVIEFATLNKTYKWKIFAVIITDPSYDYIQTEFNDSDQYFNFIKTMQEKSIFKIDVSLSPSDDILILSTCTYEYDDARFVVAARREG